MENKHVYWLLGGGAVLTLIVGSKTGIFKAIGDVVGGVSGFVSGVFDGSIIDGESDREEMDRINKQLEEDIKRGLKPTFSVAQFVEGANKIEKALKGWGNDPQAVAEVFDNARNIQDVRMLSKYFGMRAGQNMNEWLKSDIINNLTLWVNLKNNKKMSIVNFVTIADMVREILKRNGIPFAI